MVADGRLTGVDLGAVLAEVAALTPRIAASVGRLTRLAAAPASAEGARIEALIAPVAGVAGAIV